MTRYSTNISVCYYRPLSIGGEYVNTYHQAWNKKLIWGAFGGPLTFQFHLRGKRFVDEWVQSGLGRHVEVYGPGLELIWEGFVNVVQANIGTVALSRGPFIKVGNKVRVEYSTIDWATGEPNYGARKQTDWVEATDSQAKYGILEKIVSTAGASVARAEQIRDVAIGELKEPITSESENLSQSSIPSVTVQCVGYIQWLETYTYTSTTTGDEYASVKLTNVLGAEPNGIFSTDYSDVTENQTPVGAYEEDYRKAMSIVKGVTAVGDSSYNRSTFQFTEGRKAKFGSIPTSVKYQRALLEPRQAVQFYGTGGYVDPWKVQPAQWLYYTDLIPGGIEPSSDFRTDLRFIFLEEVQFREPNALSLRGSRVTHLKQMLNQFGVGGYHP